jgi:hypothetical protein
MRRAWLRDHPGEEPLPEHLCELDHPFPGFMPGIATRLRHVDYIYLRMWIMSAEDKIPEAGAPEIEATPAMIEAGAEIVWTYFDEVIAWGSPSGRDLASRVFAAMDSLRER